MWLPVAGLASVAVFVVGAILVPRPADLDAPIRAATQPQVGGVAELVLRGFAVAGGTRCLFLFAATVGVFAALVLKDWRPGVALTVALVGASLSAHVLKDLFERPSPEEWTSGQTLGTAFPSSHAATSIAVWGLVAVCATMRLSRVRAQIVTVIAAVMIAGTASSRVLLGDHWASDVLAGVGLGGLWLCVGGEICLRPRRVVG